MYFCNILGFILFLKLLVAQLKRIVGMPKMRGVRFPPAPSDHGPNAFMGGYYRLYMRINPGVSFYELSVISKIGYVITVSNIIIRS